MRNAFRSASVALAVALLPGCTFPEAVRKLLETLAKSSDFRTMLSETVK